MSEGGTGKQCLIYCAQHVVYFALVLAVELRLPQMLWYLVTVTGSTYSYEEDVDVAAERHRVRAMSLQQRKNGDIITLFGLTKVSLLLLLVVSSSLYVSNMFVTRAWFLELSFSRISESTAGYTFTPCVESFTSPGIDTR